ASPRPACTSSARPSRWPPGPASRCRYTAHDSEETAMIESWTQEQFNGRVGETFVLHLWPDPAPVKRTAVTAGARPPKGRAQFSLFFRGPRAALRRQGTYRVEHPELGAHDLFLVPVGVTPEDGGSVLYEAVFT